MPANRHVNQAGLQSEIGRVRGDSRGRQGSARDDLTRIVGLGQDIARRLDEAGIRTYAELADCSAGDIAKALPGLHEALSLLRKGLEIVPWRLLSCRRIKRKKRSSWFWFGLLFR